MTIRIQALSVDTTDPEPIATWWSQALGWHITYQTPDEWVLEPPAGSPEDGVAPDMLFLKVPEGKAAKNRLHLDLRPDDHDAEVARFETLGFADGLSAKRCSGRRQPGPSWSPGAN